MSILDRADVFGCARRTVPTKAPNASRPMTRSVRAHCLRFAAASFLLSGCDGTKITAPEGEGDVSAHVSGPAALALDATGRFVLPEPASPSSEPIVTPLRARDLAASYVLSFGPALERFWEDDRGRPIDHGRLRADERVFFAATPYDLVPDGFHPAFRRVLGPYYLVQMGSGADPELQVATAAYNTELGINGKGKLDIPPLSGMEFVSAGVPVDTLRPHRASVLTPEQAVVRVGRATGARIREVPELVQLGHPLGPLYPAWKLTLDRSVRVRTADGARTVEVDTLYIGRVQGRELLIPGVVQPSHAEVPGVRIGPGGEDLGPATIRVAVRTGQPTVFDPVSVARGGN